MTVHVECTCTHGFDVPADRAGGYVNCPRCGRAAPVPGLRDPLWRALQGGAVAAWAGAVVWAAAALGVPAAVLVALGGALLLWLLSRAL